MMLLAAPVTALNEPINLIGLLACVLIPASLDVFFFLLFHRYVPRIAIVTSEILFLLGYLFNILPLLIIGAGAVTFVLIYSFIVNSADVRGPFSNAMVGKPLWKKSKKKQGEALFDREEVYGKIRDAVLWMSKHKMGAIISFEQKDSLQEQIKSGTIINAPISAEILQTIFYPGTRLHDGAVVIRDNVIVAASVYYTPTVRPLTGKFGSRHRAAIGISEISDCVTVVVSEETGRICIAYEGQLDPIVPDQFFDTFMEYMSGKKAEQN